MTDHPFGISPEDEARSEQRAFTAVFATAVAGFYRTLRVEDTDRRDALDLTGRFIHTMITKDQK